MNCNVPSSLTKCSKNSLDSARADDDEEIIKQLQNDSTRYNSLLYIRTKLIKKQDGVKKLCEHGGIKQLLNLLEKPKLTDIVLSILANCCLDNNVRTQVLSNGGAKSIARVFQCLASESVQNRACRALANLGLTPLGSKVINKQDVMGAIIKFLSATKSPECQQTAVRALRILGDVPRHRLRVIQEEGLVRISELLESDNAEVVKCCTKSLAWLTQRCSLEGALQVHRGQGLTSLVRLCDHADPDVWENALKTLVNLCFESGIRPELGNAGVVPVLIQHSQSTKDSRTARAAASALCLCCREAINRVRIRDEGGLQILMTMLGSEEHEELHHKIIMSLLALRYDEACIEVLLDLKLVPTLVSHLNQFVKCNRKEHFLNNSDEESIGAPEISLKLNDYLNGLIQNSKAALDEVTTADSLRDEKFDDLLSDKNSDTEYESDDALHMNSSLHRSNSVSKVFCIHSPSYQQVQSEMQSGLPFLDTYSREPYYRDAQSPTSSTSYCLSPDCSSPSWGSPSSPSFWSPAASPASSSQQNWSPVLSEAQSVDLDASPLQSPSMDGFCYSPVCEQNFSEEENDSDLGPGDVQRNFEVTNTSDSISLERQSNTCSYSLSMSFDAQNDVLGTTRSAGISFQDALDADSSTPSTSTGISFENNPLKLNQAALLGSKSSPKGIPLKRRRSVAPEPLKRNRRDMSNHTSSFVSTGNGCSKNSKQQSEDLTSGGLIIQILSHLSQMEKPCTLLATEDCITSIIDYVSLLPAPSPRAERVLSRLTRNYYCYESLVSFGIVRLLQQKLRPKHLITACESCNQLQILQKKLMTNLSLASESGYGLGVLSHALFNGTPQEKINCILAVPYLVRGHKLLQKLLFECGGLSHLLSMLNPNQSNFSQAVESICQLCRQWIKPATISIKKSLIPPQCPHVSNVTLDVYFSLDDGSKVGANRAKMCQNSPFFSAMLEGSFMESAQNQLKLPQVSEAAFQVILHFLYRCSLVSCTKLQSTNTDTLLELIALSDRFLMHDLRDDIIKKIIGGFCAENIGEIYMHSLRYDWEELRQSVLRQLLVGSMDTQERILCFKKLLLFEEHFRNDLKTLVSDHFPERQQKSYTPQD